MWTLYEELYRVSATFTLPGVPRFLQIADGTIDGFSATTDKEALLAFVRAGLEDLFQAHDERKGTKL